MNEKLLVVVVEWVIVYCKENNLLVDMLVLVDVVIGLGFGLDLVILVVNVKLQVLWVVQVCNILIRQVECLIEDYIDVCGFGFLGECVVNVFRLNFVLDCF